MWYIICDGRVITCTQTIANMVVVNDRGMTNVHVVDSRLPWPINGGLHTVISSRMVRERLIPNKTVKTRSESAILSVSYNTEYKTWSIDGSLRYSVLIRN